MQIEHGAGACSEIDERASVNELEHNDLILHERGERYGVLRNVAKLCHLFAAGGDDVEAFTQPLAQEKELDPRLIAFGQRVLTNESVPREHLQVPVDLRLGRIELPREVRDTE